MIFSYTPQGWEPRRGGAGQPQPQVPVNSELAAPMENPQGLLALFQRRSSQAGLTARSQYKMRPRKR